MAKHIENIVIGESWINESEIFASSPEDWEENEIDKTTWTNERFLPKILVDLGFTTSTSEIRRNRPDLVKTLDKIRFLEIKLGKRKLWILIGD